MRNILLALVIIGLMGCAGSRYVRIEATDAKIKPGFFQQYVPELEAEHIIYEKFTIWDKVQKYEVETEK